MSPRVEEWARQARDFVASRRHAALCTVSRSPKGYPYGSLVDYDITEAGAIIIYVSAIAEHFKNLSADPRASVSILDPESLSPSAGTPRATLLTEFTHVPDNEIPVLRASYEKRCPNAMRPDLLGNFAFMKGVPQRIYWIGSFGDIGWIDGSLYCRVTPDPLAYDRKKLLSKVTKAQLVDLVRGSGKFNPKKGVVRVSDLDASGITIVIGNRGKEEQLKLSFPELLTSTDDFEPTLEKLLCEARKKFQ